MDTARAVGKILTAREVKDMINYMTLTGSHMQTDKFRNLVASIGPDLVTELMTTNMTAKLVEAYHDWPETWKKWIEIDKTEYMNDQVRERMAQLGMVPALKDTGGRFQEIAAPQGQELTFSVDGYGGYIPVDLRTRRSDHLGYFNKIGTRLGRAEISRFHQYLYINMIQANPTHSDGYSLFDDTYHHNDVPGDSTGYAITYATLLAALQKGETMVDASGEPIGSGLNYWLLCGTRNVEAATQLMKNEFKPGTANRDVNALKGRIIGVDPSRKLGYDWYLVADKKDLPGLTCVFLDGKEDPTITAEKADSSYQFENPGQQRWRVDHWYGFVWEYPEAIIRGGGTSAPA